MSFDWFRLLASKEGACDGGLERDGGRDVQHATASVLDHARQDSPDELNQSSDVNGDDVDVPAVVASVEGTVYAIRFQGRPWLGCSLSSTRMAW